MYCETTEGITITVKPYFLDEQSAPDEVPLRLGLSRPHREQRRAHGAAAQPHWRITDSLGRTQEVRGAGVVGRATECCARVTASNTPAARRCRPPRGSWRAPIRWRPATPGEQFDVKIPSFSLDSPHQPGQVELTASSWPQRFPLEAGPPAHRPIRPSNSPIQVASPDRDPFWKEPAPCPSPPPRSPVRAPSIAAARHGPPQKRLKRPSRSEAEAAVRTLIRWAGDDPRPRRAAGHARRESCAPMRNSSPAMTRIRSPSCSAPSRRPTAMTRWWCCATSASSRIASTTWCPSSAAPISPICRASA